MSAKEIKVYEAQRPLREIQQVYNPDYTEPVVLKRDHDQALSNKDKEIAELKAEFKQLEEVFRNQCEELREVVKTFDDVAHVGRRLSWSLVNEYKNAKVEIEVLREKLSDEIYLKYPSITAKKYMDNINCEIEAKKESVK